MLAEAFVATAFRAFVGLVGGIVAAAVGYFVGWGVWGLLSVGSSSAIPFAVSCAGLGGSVGALLGWAGVDRSGRTLLLFLALALLGGLAGAWVGYAYGKLAYDTSVVTSGGAWGGVLKLFTYEVNRPTAVAIMLGGGVGADLLLLFRDLVRAWRHGLLE